LETITLNAWNGLIKLCLREIWGFPDNTCHFGGYDVTGEIEIQCDNYIVKGGLNFSTGDIYNFYTQLNQLYNSLKGAAKFCSYEEHLLFIVNVDKSGHVRIEGDYREDLAKTTKLIFALEVDQSYLKDWLTQLKMIVNKYGDNSGVKK
jgi:hypothetical protein